MGQEEQMNKEFCSTLTSILSLRERKTRSGR